MKKKYHTIIIGSGASGLNCAIELNKRDIPASEIAIFTVDEFAGTSYNAGSDKQTYYRLSLVGDDKESPNSMAHALYDGGAMHGDIALIESTNSIRCFMNLVNMGVNFPHDKYGTFVGYKTDNDNLQRGTSVGPLTSKEMTRVLNNEVKRRNIPIIEHLLVIDLIKNKSEQICGLIALDLAYIKTTSEMNQDSIKRALVTYHAENIVMATGGPAGMYKDSVYPLSHWGSTSLAIRIGAKLQNLTESQYGLASLKFRWNVSGSYQQVIPRYISFDANEDPMNPASKPIEFLVKYFPGIKELTHATFLKGYQWPFNPERIENYGSSLIDMAIYIERIIKKRRVFMDFRQNPMNYDFNSLTSEVTEYLSNSEANQNTPIERLDCMNPEAITLFHNHGIDLWKEPLEVGICAQHCNGGITGDIWWQTNVKNLFIVGEANGSHGVHRPGGSALNSGQVGSLRAAQKIAHNSKSASISKTTDDKLIGIIRNHWTKLFMATSCNSKHNSDIDYNIILKKIQNRMMIAGAYIRSKILVNKYLLECKEDIKNFSDLIKCSKISDIPNIWKVYDALICQFAFFISISEYLKSGGGSRGSFLVIADENTEEFKIVHELLKKYPSKNRDYKFDEKILEIQFDRDDLDFTKPSMNVELNWVDRRLIPQKVPFFEKMWHEFENGSIFE